MQLQIKNGKWIQNTRNKVLVFISSRETEHPLSSSLQKLQKEFQGSIHVQGLPRPEVREECISWWKELGQK